jgi:hypothetical protein
MPFSNPIRPVAALLCLAASSLAAQVTVTLEPLNVVPGGSVTLALANGIHLSVDRGELESRAALPLRIQPPPDRSELEVDFTFIDSDGRLLGPAEGGVVRRMGDHWEYLAPATDRQLHLTIRVTARTPQAESDETKITVVGNPGSEPQRWGLARLGLDEWPRQAEDYATLVCPMALAVLDANESLVLGTGACLARLNGVFERLRTEPWPGSALPAITPALPAAPPEAGRPWPLTFSVAYAPQPAAAALPQPAAAHAPGWAPFQIDYYLTCTDSGSEVPLHGRGRFLEPITVTAPALVAGENPVRIRCVTLGGRSMATRVTVTAVAQALTPAPEGAADPDPR